MQAKSKGNVYCHESQLIHCYGQNKGAFVAEPSSIVQSLVNPHIIDRIISVPMKRAGNCAAKMPDLFSTYLHSLQGPWLIVGQASQNWVLAPVN